ncbi:MAG: M48 family metallopeptidase [Chitinophagales bacterium]|nr:M48 family metallopeptidase [Chitinophagales bacterium]
MNLDYKIVYSDRKTLDISVQRDRSIVVRAPLGADESKIHAAIEKKRMWLFEKTHHPQKYKVGIYPKEFVSGESIMFLGKLYKLSVEKTDFKGVKFDNRFEISKSSQPNASAIFKEWYKQQAEEKIIPKVEYFATHLGVRFKNIKVLDLKYRWGSCTPKDNLNFNWRLVKAPMYVIDYIIVHELVHLLEVGHTDRFWNIVKTQVPKFNKAKEWLKENGGLLERDF